MINKEQIYNELEFLEIGQVMLLNPSNKLEYPCFFIKERNCTIKKLINKKSIGFQIMPFQFGNVIAYLILLIINKNEDDIYGQWFNKYNKTDRKNYFELNFKDFIKIVFVDENNKVKCINTYGNILKGNIKNFFYEDNLEQPWHQKEFDMAVSYFNNIFGSKKNFYEEFLTND